MITSSSILPVMRNVSEKVVEKIGTLIFSVTCFRKPCGLWDNVEKYGKAGQETRENTTQKRCNLHAG